MRRPLPPPPKLSKEAEAAASGNGHRNSGEHTKKRWKIAIERVDLAIESGDFPDILWFHQSHGWKIPFEPGALYIKSPIHGPLSINMLNYQRVEGKTLSESRS